MVAENYKYNRLKYAVWKLIELCDNTKQHHVSEIWQLRIGAVKEVLAEFALLKIDIDEAIIRKKYADEKKAEHDKMGCPFNYCDSNPKCEGKCRYAS